MVRVGVTDERESALRAANIPIPPAVEAAALIDTGASCCAVDKNIIEQLSLTPTGFVQIHTPSTNSAAHSCAAFDVRVTLVHPVSSGLIRSPVSVIQSNLAARHNYSVLIGRDILSDCFFFYNGDVGRFALAF
jgi:predicted aspartyl protease